MRIVPAALLAIAVALALASAPASAAEVYKWVDANGLTHYAQHQPPATRSVEIAVREDSPDQAGQNDTMERLRARLKSMEEKTQRAQQEANAEPSQEQQLAEQRSVNCGIARANLSALRQKRNTRYFDAQGKRIRLSSEEKAGRIETAKSNIDKYCG